MPTWDEVKQWKSAQIGKIADSLIADRNKLLSLQDEVNDAATPREWTGEAAEAAKTQLKRYTQDLEDLVAGLSAVAVRVSETETTVKAVANAIDEAESLAATHEYRIKNGDVIPLFDPEDTEPGSELDATRAQVESDLKVQIEQILRRAEDIDHDLDTVMEKAMSGGISDGGGTTLAAAALSGTLQGFTEPVMPPKGGTPEENKAWWDTLSKGERDWLVRNQPEFLGNRNGLPAAVRHEANVKRVPEERRKILQELQKLRTRLDNWDSWAEKAWLEGEIEKVNAKLEALDVLEDQANENGNLVMSLDTSGERVRAAIGMGDVDMADYLNVYTPGMNSAVAQNMSRYVDELGEVQRYTDQMLENDPATAGQKSATVVWMDYLPPQGNINEGYEVLGEGRAKAGAERLAGFLDGVEASRGDNPPERLTATGHSYGSLTTALALRQTDAADAFVSQGSPGWGDGGSSSIRVPDRMYNLSADGDFVADSGTFGDDPSYAPGVRELSTFSGTTAEGEALGSNTGHTTYTEADSQKSTSEYNTAAVIAGKDNQTIPFGHRTPGPAGPR